MDLLDLIIPKKQYANIGKFFEERPEVKGGGIEISYEEVYPLTQNVMTVFGNVLGVDGALTIRTATELTIDSKNLSEYITVHKVMQRARIQTQDGRMFMIDQVVKEIQEQKGERLPFKIPVGQSYLLRLIPVDNGWGI